MDIIFNAQYYSGDELIPDAMKNYYKCTLEFVFRELSKDMELTALKSIIVPDDFKDELFSFQKSKGLDVGCTDNDMGTAHARVVTSFEKDSIVRSIFLNKNLVCALLGDTEIDAMGENKDLAIKCRSLAINTLHHELAHIHEYALSDRIYNHMSTDDTQDFLLNKLREYAISIWGEYYACRFSASTYNLNVEEVENILDQIKNVEERIKNEIYAYRTHGDIDKLVSELQSRTQILMKYVAYFQGHLFVIDKQEIRDEVINSVGNTLVNTFFSEVWFKMNAQLNTLYETHSEWESIDVFGNLGETVTLCWNKLGIYPKSVSDGVYYSIP